MKRVSVLLAEDGWAMSRELGAILARECDLLATVSDGLALVRLAREMRPDVVVTDISMPGINGLQAVESLIEEGLAPHVVFVTVHAEPQLVMHALALGPCGYVLKADAVEDLLPAVRAASQGRRYLSASVAAS
ncbi:response regulator transcription factor [Stenotrophomonas sp. HITSZ_GD]|uniref:response regulator n=1 Tax=Stenotrophomonas sp. HITSZ_GD TaxID=3037248 RepID=UPI00240CEE44|nr:response regulator transcription factor [Stenotrophomonas sp. HITSZ_GD]MDG2527047.1 response regulator transcription factor [Stenotrophomonas sp. HITSZ_GD]